MKTLLYRFVHFVRGLILGKPKYYMGVDHAYQDDKMVVTVLARHKDDGVTVVDYEIEPTKKDIERLVKTFSLEDYEPLLQGYCNCENNERNPIDATMCGWCGKRL